MHILHRKIFSAPNGTPGRQFLCKRGVRQGDPLSPLIFVLDVDLLQAAVNKAFAAGHIQLPIPTPDGDYPVIQYADDTIVILPAEVSQAEHMKKILKDYATSVGLRINFQRSTLVTMNTPDDLTKQLADTFGCAVWADAFHVPRLAYGHHEALGV